MPDSPIPPPIPNDGASEEPSAAESISSFHEKLLDSLYDGVYFVDRERRITYWNKGAEQLTGYPAAGAVGRQCFDNFLMHVNEEGCALCFGGCPLAATLADGERREAEVYLRHKLGHRVPVYVRVSPIKDGSGHVVGAVEIFNDISAKKKIERRAGELETLAFQDSLTGVPNRRYIELKVEQAIQEVDGFGRHFGLLMIDVDQFKQVNDTYGHATGDLALRTICETLSHNLRPGDALGRWGGEEFLVICMDVTPAALMAFAERCRNLIAESVVPAESGVLRFTVSVGATLITRGESAQSAINRADELMYKSKTSGRNRTVLG